LKILLLRRDDKSFSLITPAIESLRAVAPMNDIYLITKVQNDEEESQVMQLLTDQNLSINPLVTFKAVVNSHKTKKLLFCETDEGRAHVTRQLEAHVHVDSILF
jgi:hypothetical protein